MEHFPTRRKRLRDKMRELVLESDPMDISSFEQVLSWAANTAMTRCREDVWDEADHHKLKKFPIPRNGLHQSFDFPRHCHRALSMRWFLHRFPADINKVRETIGASSTTALRSLAAIQPKSKWSSAEVLKVESAIDSILEHLPSN